MGATPPYGTHKFAAQRVTKINAAGNPIVGANNGYFTKQVVEGTIGVDKEDGSRETLRNGMNRVCQTSKADDEILGSTLEVQYCVLDAVIIHFMTGARLMVSGAVPAGYEILGPGDAAPNGVIWEGWTLAWDNDQQAVPTIVGDVAYHHWVIPRLKAQVDDIDINTEHTPIPVTGAGSSNDEATVNGPYDDWPAWVVANGGITRPYGVFLDDLPTNPEGYLAVTALAS